MAIGINRDLQNKPIGMRTLALVALGAALVAVAGIDHPGMAPHPDALSRVIQGIIQGVMAGISFIGAGVILRDAQSKTVEGLTTAATVWVAAALGIACGLAAWTAVGIAPHRIDYPDRGRVDRTGVFQEQRLVILWRALQNQE